MTSNFVYVGSGGSGDEGGKAETQGVPLVVYICTTNRTAPIPMVLPRYATQSQGFRIIDV